MTQAARVYGESMYALALEEELTGEILEEMKVIRTLFQENPDYVHLLSEPSIPGNERIDLIEAAFGNQAERYLVNFLTKSSSGIRRLLRRICPALQP